MAAPMHCSPIRIGDRSFSTRPVFSCTRTCVQPAALPPVARGQPLRLLASHRRVVTCMAKGKRGRRRKGKKFETFTPREGSDEGRPAPAELVETVAVEKPDVEAEEQKLEELEQMLGMMSANKSKSRQLQQEQAELDPLEKNKWENLDWDNMTRGEKAYQLYMGEKGFLYWITQLTLYASGLVVVAWVCVRFLGPAFGLYKVL
mmetsp:Transcript_8019/g.29637  ORF Transcript_8019/g.29637 Transcript_8019/m.29637 type:complete len:203 (-) Transcript_8019:3763-4371(-)